MARQCFFKFFLRGALIGSLVVPSLSFSENIVCPRTLIINQDLPRMDNPWETILEEVPIQLMSVSIFEGHPKQHATLVPEEEITKDKKIVNTWQLISNTKEIFWLGCSYDRTNVMLLRPIDANFRTCQITYDPSVSVGGHPSVVEINCF